MRYGTSLISLVLVLSACTEPNPGYEGEREQGVACAPGSRTCSGQSVMVCVPSGATTSWQLERACPPTSTCRGGFCLPGAGACTGSCEAGLVCTVFVNPVTLNTLATFCAKPVGSKPGGAPCAGDAECASGFCISRGKWRTCYQACGKSGSCPAPTKCAELTMTVNGVQGTVSGCVF